MRQALHRSPTVVRHSRHAIPFPLATIAWLQTRTISQPCAITIAFSLSASTRSARTPAPHRLAEHYYGVHDRDFVINLGAAKALGRKVPPSIMLMADKVIE